VSTSDWLLMLHVSSAFLLVGASFTAAILNVLAIRAERPSEAALLLGLIRRALPVLFLGVAGTLVFGIWLWHEKGYGIDQWWLWGALVLWAIANALGGAGGRFQESARKLAEQLAASGDAQTPELRTLLRDTKGNALSWLAGAATLGVLVLMIWKPGA
jgi:uncharacterized membrane protein